MAAALAGKNKEGAGRGGNGIIQRRITKPIVGGIRSSVRAPRARIDRLEDDNRGLLAARVREIMEEKGALEKQVRELRGALVSMCGDLEESRAGEKMVVLEKDKAVLQGARR